MKVHVIEVDGALEVAEGRNTGNGSSPTREDIRSVHLGRGRSKSKSRDGRKPDRGHKGKGSEKAGFLGNW